MGPHGRPLLADLQGSAIKVQAGLALVAGSMAVIAALGLAATASARVPKWLHPPYRNYTLTYDATISSQGTSTDSYPNPSFGSQCDQYTSSYQGSVSSHFKASYALVFGQYHPRGGPSQLAVVFQRGPTVATGSLQATSHETTASGCPPPPFGDANATCTSAAGSDSPPALDYFQRPLVNPRVFGLTLDFTGTQDAALNCSQDNPHDPDIERLPDHFTIVDPAGGRVYYSKAGIRARRTFHGQTSWSNDLGQPISPRNGSGTDPETDPAPQVMWSFDTQPRATLTLSPARG
jgi:hypothetical protein